MKGEAPFFTVVLATWNRAPLLPRALESLRAQSEPSWESVVVDDGSTDGTAAVLRGFAEDPRVRYLAVPHRGLSAARNTGLAAARGAWTTFLDSDDAFEPDHLAVRRRYIERHPEILAFHGGYRVIGPPEAHYVPDARDPKRLIPIAECVVGGTLVVRTDLLRALGGFPDVPYAMDFELMKALRGRGPVVTVEEKTYLYYRDHRGGMCAEAAPG